MEDLKERMGRVEQTCNNLQQEVGKIKGEVEGEQIARQRQDEELHILREGQTELMEKLTQLIVRLDTYIQKVDQQDQQIKQNDKEIKDLKYKDRDTVYKIVCKIGDILLKLAVPAVITAVAYAYFSQPL